MSILVDTSFFIAYSNIRDKNYRRSREVARDIFSGKYGQAIVTDYIFDETITTHLYRINRILEVEKLGDYILGSEIELFQINSELFKDAWFLFKKYHYSFTDCVSATFTKKYNIKYIATFDRHFDSFKWLNRIC